MLVISVARIPRCWRNTRPPFISGSLGIDLSLRPDAELDQYLYSSVAIIDRDGFPHNRSLVGALELSKSTAGKILWEREPQHFEEQLRPLKNGLRVGSQAGLNVAEATICFSKGYP